MIGLPDIAKYKVTGTEYSPFKNVLRISFGFLVLSKTA
jgi:hypothetical protein